VSTIEGFFDILSSILGMAVEDGLLPKNPCKSKSVKLPTATKKKILPWPLERVRAVIEGLPKRFQAGGKLAFGCPVCDRGRSSASPSKTSTSRAAGFTSTARCGS
jgi:hypothetical protein